MPTKKIDPKTQKIIAFYLSLYWEKADKIFQITNEKDLGTHIKRNEEKEDLETTISGILSKAESLLPPNDYKGFLKTIKIKPKEAESRISEYNRMKEGAKRPISEITILHTNTNKTEGIILVYGSKEKKTISPYIAIEYAEESRLQGLIAQALEKVNHDRELLEKIEKEISFRGRGVKKQ